MPIGTLLKRKHSVRAIEERLAEKEARKSGAAKRDTFDPYQVRRPTDRSLGWSPDKPALPNVSRLTSHEAPLASKLVPPDTPIADSSKLAAPYIPSAEDKAMIEKIYAHAEQERSPQYTEATDPVFGPADPELTKQLVPQRSIAQRLPPKLGLDDTLPSNDRSKIILEHEDLIGSQLADWMRNSPHAADPLPFYSTGSVIQGLIDKGGLSHEEAIQFMKDWAGQGAATSPRTATPQNLRNAAYLLFRNMSGDRLTKLRQKMEQEQGLFGFPKTHNQNPLDKQGNPIKANLNRPGFAMMGMHAQLGDEFFGGTVDPWKNPKPYTFQQNWSGNMADVTADTHNIRATLDALETVAPGSIPRGWFKNDAAYERYLNGGVFGQDSIDVGAIEDGLKGQMINGRYAQTEYPIMQGPTIKAARELNISPAEAQERLWFDRGSRTGLQSPRLAIPDILNSQIEKTSRVLGIPPEQVLKLFARHRIPLAANEPDQTLPGASSVG